jgi:hypothetical protein
MGCCSFGLEWALRGAMEATLYIHVLPRRDAQDLNPYAALGLAFSTETLARSKLEECAAANTCVSETLFRCDGLAIHSANHLLMS